MYNNNEVVNNIKGEIKLSQENNQLISTSLLLEYYLVNDQYRELKKRRDKLNKELKSIIKEPIELFQDGYKIRAYNQDRSKFNEERTLLYLKGRGLQRCIKTIEKIDEEELEAAIYNGDVSKKDLEFCIDQNLVLAILITKEG